MKKRVRLYDVLKEGLEEAIAHEKGEKKLRVTEIVLPPPPSAYSPEDVVRLRESLHLSQAALARVLLVSNKTVQAWEQGTRRPSHAAARLLQFIEQPDLLLAVRGMAR